MSENREALLERVLKLIRQNPGIRPRDINKSLGLEQSDALRDTLIKRGQVRKTTKGREVHLYPKGR